MIVIEQAPSTKQNPAFLNQADWSPLSVLGFEPYNTIKFIIYFVMFQVIHFYLTCGSLDAFLRNSYCKGSFTSETSLIQMKEWDTIFNCNKDHLKLD